MNQNKLDELIPNYAMNKMELDSYTKICDKEKAEIKKLMLDSKIPEYITKGYRATCTTSTRESINEDILLAILNSSEDAKILGIIKTKEYVDYDALEDAIYNERISRELILELDKAKDSKEVITLKVSKLKEKK